MGSGCSSVGRAVAPDSRGPWFESRHWQKIYIEHFTVNCIEKTKIKKKRPGKAHFLKKNNQKILLALDNYPPPPTQKKKKNVIIEIMQHLGFYLR